MSLISKEREGATPLFLIGDIYGIIFKNTRKNTKTIRQKFTVYGGKFSKVFYSHTRL